MAAEDGRAALRAFLAASGPARAAEAMAHLGISHTSFTRLLEASGSDVLAVGRARATRYLASRSIPDLGRSLPTFEVLDDGGSRLLGRLHAVLPGSSFYLEALTEDAESARFDDLPYFIEDLRPSGFLGRLVPRQHPELQLPDDIQLWTANHCLSYLTRHGWNLPGSLIVGDAAFRLHLEHVLQPGGVVESDARATRYPELAEDVLSHGVPGSSAAGEQPKFLASRAPGPTPVLVKFSPPVVDAISARVADLLIAEFHALETMRAHGQAAARAELLQAAGRTFLEVERFDRFSGGGRRGLVSMRAFDLQFAGGSSSWTQAAARLVDQRLIPPSMLIEIRQRQLFGRLIANTDMHGGNLSFFTRGTQVIGLAPAYDMAPALYAPAYGQLRTPVLAPSVPHPDDAPHWAASCAASLDLWNRVASDARVSASFREVAAANAAVVGRARDLQRLLPV